MAADGQPFDLVGHYTGPIQALIDDPEVTEVMVNRYDEVFVERGGKIERCEGITFDNEEKLVAFIRQIANSLSQSVTPDKRPILDARLPNGSRINAVLKPVAVASPTVSIRPARVRAFSMDDLVARKMLTQEIADHIEAAVTGHRNIVISGGTGSGKTTLLRAIGSYFGQHERILVVEDTTEFIVPEHPHTLMYEAPSRSGGSGGEEITMARLIRNALRNRPDRIVVGEIRTPPAAAAFIEALNTGHGGTVSTTHANNAEDTLNRIIMLHAAETPHVPYEILSGLVRRSIGLVVNIAALYSEELGRVRRVNEVASINVEGQLILDYRYNADTDSWLTPER